MWSSEPIPLFLVISLSPFFCTYLPKPNHPCSLSLYHSKQEIPITLREVFLYKEGHSFSRSPTYGLWLGGHSVSSPKAKGSKELCTSAFP